MKRWALLVAGLYFLILLTLTLPAILAAFFPGIKLKEAVGVYGYGGYWLWLVLMCGSQFALLIVPVKVVSRRPVTKGALWPPILAGGLMMAGLIAGAVYSLYEFVFRDKGKGDWIGWVGLGLGAITWLAWLIIFSRLSKSTDPSDLIARQCRVLLKGSIVELLIAVPTHIVARSRGYCCAGFMTFLGLTMGISVLLFSFGPAVFFLYVDRWRRLHPTQE